MFKLAESRGTSRGPYCGLEGLYLGSAALIERRDGRFYLRAEDEIATLLVAAYDPAPDGAGRLARMREVVVALAEEDLSRAMIAALQLQLGEISEEGILRLAEVDDLLKHNFNSLQPRDRHGQWSGDTSAGVLPAASAARRGASRHQPAGPGSASPTQTSAIGSPLPKGMPTSPISAMARHGEATTRSGGIRCCLMRFAPLA
jgi:hypothetical protein